MKFSQASSLAGAVAVGILVCTVYMNPEDNSGYRHGAVTVAATTAALTAIAAQAQC